MTQMNEKQAWFDYVEHYKLRAAELKKLMNSNFAQRLNSSQLLTSLIGRMSFLIVKYFKILYTRKKMP